METGKVNTPTRQQHGDMPEKQIGRRSLLKGGLSLMIVAGLAACGYPPADNSAGPNPTSLTVLITAVPTRSVTADGSSPMASPMSEGENGAKAISGTMDLTGKVSHKIPGTLLAPGAWVTSTVRVSDQMDVYSLSLNAGQTVAIVMNIQGDGNMVVTVADPGATSFDQHVIDGGGNFAFGTGDFVRSLTATTAGTYYLGITSDENPLPYTLAILNPGATVEL